MHPTTSKASGTTRTRRTAPRNKGSATEQSPVTLERTLRAPLDQVWTLWTTREGLERWWGPEGFRSEVRRLELRVGGQFEIVMTAQLKEIIEHLAASGLSKRSAAKGRYTEVVRSQRLAYTNTVDFIPGVPPYQTTTTVTLSATPVGETRLVVVNGAMHNPEWTKMAKMGWESQLTKLAAALG